MSAWMCSEAHFNALLTYAVAMDVTFQDPRTNHTAITLETSQGHFALALALGAVLIAISITVSGFAFWIEARIRQPALPEIA